MKSDLAKSVKDVPLPDQDDRFLVTHYLAGQHEIDELDTLLESLRARRDEAAAVHRTISLVLRERHPAGVNFTIGKALLQVAPAGVTIAKTEVLTP